MKRTFFEITVTGKGEFPFDMLRYSRCWPVDGESANNLCTPDTLSKYSDKRTVRLGMIGHITEATSCIERFKSFNWAAEEFRANKI